MIAYQYALRRKLMSVQERTSVITIGTWNVLTSSAYEDVGVYINGEQYTGEQTIIVPLGTEITIKVYSRLASRISVTLNGVSLTATRESGYIYTATFTATDNASISFANTSSSSANVEITMPA